MSSKTEIVKSTKSFSQSVEELKNLLESADAVLVGAGAGLSESAGFSYSGERFEKYFSDFQKKYGITDMYSGGFYPFETSEEYWAWWSRHIYYNRYDVPVGKPYSDLLKLLKDKDYFVLTTNVDHQFLLAGFETERLFYTQGDYGLWQCSKPCHSKTYDNKEAVEKMVKEQWNMKIPSALIPRCPVCGAEMTMNLRCDDRFVEDEGWYAAAKRYRDFLKKTKKNKLLLLELGVGMNTPGIIKYPFLKMTAENKNAFYVCINYNEAFSLKAVENRSLCIESDINKVIGSLL